MQEMVSNGIDGVDGIGGRRKMLEKITPVMIHAKIPFGKDAE
jgi:hypothetical protein